MISIHGVVVNLEVIDMAEGIDKHVRIESVRLVAKDGGKSGRGVT